MIGVWRCTEPNTCRVAAYHACSFKTTRDKRPPGCFKYRKSKKYRKVPSNLWILPNHAPKPHKKIQSLKDLIANKDWAVDPNFLVKKQVIGNADKKAIF